jgi:hypothetical protein
MQGQQDHLAEIVSQDSSSGRLYHSPAKPPDPDPPFSYGRSWQV